MRPNFELPTAHAAVRSAIAAPPPPAHLPVRIGASEPNCAPLTPVQLAYEFGLEEFAMPTLRGLELPAVHLYLTRGHVLYCEGAPARYVYLVKSGLIQRTRFSEKIDRNLRTVAFAGPGELIGLPDRFSRHPESVSAIMDTHLLAVPLIEWRRLDAYTRVLDELVVRRLSAALMHDWKVAYKLRDLPLNARIVCGLSYLVGLTTGRDQRPTHLAMNLTWDVLAQWLGTRVDLLMPRLLRLERHGVLASRRNVIRSLNIARLNRLSPQPSG